MMWKKHPLIKTFKNKLKLHFNICELPLFVPFPSWGNFVFLELIFGVLALGGS